MQTSTKTVAVDGLESEEELSSRSEWQTLVSKTSAGCDVSGDMKHVLIPENSKPYRALKRLIPKYAVRYTEDQGYCRDCSLVAIANLWEQTMERGQFVLEMQDCGFETEG